MLVRFPNYIKKIVMRIKSLLILQVLFFLLAGEISFAQQSAGYKKYLYVARSPKDRDGFRTLKPSIEIHEINSNHKLVKVIPLPETIMNIRGIMAHAPTNRLYIAHYGSMKDAHTGSVVCVNLTDGKVIWHQKYPAAVDRGAISPDGKKIFMPSGEDMQTPYFYVINAATGREDVSQRVNVAPKTHNTIVSADNTKVFMSAFGKNMDYNWLHVVDAKTNKLITKIGPCFAVVRPFTINSKATLAFVNVNKLIGFEVGDVKTGKILFTSYAPEPYKLPAEISNSVFSHGIALTPNEKQVWVVDQKNIGLHVFDVSGLPAKAPVWKKFIKTNYGNEKDADGRFLYGETGIYGQPGWIMGSLDGKYLYTESGEIVDTDKQNIIGHLTGANGRWTHSRFALEVDFLHGKPVKAGDQFVTGRVSVNKNR